MNKCQSKEIILRIQAKYILEGNLALDTLLVSQLSPSYPATHVHMYPFTRSAQVAPFWHGLVAQSSVSDEDE